MSYQYVAFVCLVKVKIHKFFIFDFTVKIKESCHSGYEYLLFKLSNFFLCRFFSL